MKRLLLAVAAATLTLVACGSDADEVDLGIPAPTSRPAGEQGGHMGGGHGSGAAVACSPSDPLTVTAANVAFATDCLAVRSGQEFTVNFDNRDGVTHNLVIVQGSPTSGTPVFTLEPVTANSKRTAKAGPLTSGTYGFRCQFHPAAMHGTFIVV